MEVDDEPFDAGQLSDTTELPPARLRLIGYWIDEDRPDLPDPVRFIDPDWDPDHRRAVARYLNAGRPIGVGRGCSPCRLCGAPNGFEEFTDGRYQWPEGLAHYVGDHSVRLPEEVLQHVLDPSDPSTTVGLVDRSWWLTATS